MKDSVVLRAARADDLPRITMLLQAANLPVADLTPAHLRDFIVAADADRVIGAVAVERHGRAGLLRSLVVAPDVRGRGLGDALVDAIEAHARSAGLASLTLLTQTAAAFFQRRGYTVIPRAQAPASVVSSSEFTTLCPAGSTCLARSLAGPGNP